MHIKPATIAEILLARDKKLLNNKACSMSKAASKKY